MKQIYVARDTIEANLVAEMLETAGIRARVAGEHIASLQGAVPFGTSTSASVWIINDADEDEAHKQIQQYHREKAAGSGSRWLCPSCGEAIEPQFTACWNCGAEPGLAELQPAETRQPDDEDEDHKQIPQQLQPAPGTLLPNKPALWVEMGVVCILAVLPPLYNAVASLIWPQEAPSPFLYAHWYFIVMAAQVSVPLLFIIGRGVEPWASFGICRPQIIKDGLTAILLWLVLEMGRMTVWAIAALFVDVETLEATRRGAVDIAPPRRSEYLILPISCLAIGFSEELVMRGYFIPRLEYLLGSSAKAVLVSSALFATYHIYQGLAGVIDVVVCGILFGVAFCWLRRLWPLALAHALLDYISFT